MGRLKKAYVVEDAEEKSATDGAPLFQSDGDNEIREISVYRVGPVEEGSIGALPKEADEAMVHARYGGGIFKLSARGHNGRLVSTRTITVGGEPKFQSKGAVRQYKISLGELPEDPPPAEKPATSSPAPQGISVLEILTLMQKSSEQQIAMMRLQMEANAREAVEREARARREAEEARDRDRKAAEEARERDRQFQTTLLQITQSAGKRDGGGEAVSMLLKGITLARELGGEQGPTDPLALLAGNLPGIVEQLKGVVQPGQQRTLAPANGEGDRLYLDGEAALRLRTAYQTLLGKGYSPQDALRAAEAAIMQGVTLLERLPNAPEPTPPLEPAAASPFEPSPPATSPAPAPPADPPGTVRVRPANGTAPRSRATR